MRHHTKLCFRSDDGQAIVEFAIVLPVLVLLVFGITQFGLAFRNYISITDAARVGARAAAVKRTSGPCAAASTAIQSTVSAGQWAKISSRITCVAGAECRRPGLDHDPLPVLDRPARRQRLGQPHREREGADGMRALSDAPRLTSPARCSSSSRFILIVLVGMAALVIDVGSWYHAQRKLQTAADAAALAGAQHLPTQQSTAPTVALDYAQRNYAGIPAPTVTFPDAATIDVAATGGHARHLRPRCSTARSAS